jgi:hypothetical protein
MANICYIITIIHIIIILLYWIKLKDVKSVKMKWIERDMN